MKKNLFLSILACVFVSCSSDGSREIQSDEVQFAKESEIDKIEDYSKVKSIFEIVPGKYIISWRLVDKVPQLQNFNVELKLKLRLKKTVNILPSVYEKMSKATNDFTGDVVSCPFDFYLVNANGEREWISVQGFRIDYLPLDVGRVKGFYNKDQMMDFINFLASKPGTEIDIVCNAYGGKNKNNDCTEIIKNARGIICLMKDDDETFERYIGVIE